MLKKFFLSGSRSNLMMILSFVFIVAVLLYILPSPLQGIHRIRQADTLFAAYSYCIENTNFSSPRISHRENTSGIAIGEYPLFSYLLSLKCKLTGQWDEWTPKLLTWLLFFLGLFVWFKIFLQIFRLSFKRDQVISFFFIMVFCTQMHLHWMIPIPDILTVTLLGMSYWFLYQSQLRSLTSWLSNIFCFLSAVFFAVGFNIRPYFLFLFFLPFITELATASLFKRDFLKHFWTAFFERFIHRYFYWFLLTAIFTLGLYFYWYKLNIFKTEIYYYNLDITPLSQLWLHCVEIIKALFEQILRNHLNFIGLWPLLYACRKDRQAVGLTLLALLNAFFIVAIKANHIINHGYYLGLTSLLLAAVVWRGFIDFSERKKIAFISLYFLIFIANNQHLWNHDGLRNWRLMQKLVAENSVRPEDQLVSYATQHLDDTGYLYWAKRTGWAYPEAQFDKNKPCPWGGEFFLYWQIAFEQNGEKELHLGRCH